MGLFGLGGPEIAVIGVVVLFVLGPDKLKNLAKEAGKALPELKEVSAEALEGFKAASAEAAKDFKDAAVPALQELKEAATPVLSDLSEAALKEAKEVAGSFTEGAKAAEVPAELTAAASADTNAQEEKQTAVQDQTKA